MSVWQKIIVGALTGVLWLVAIAMKHFWPDVDIQMFQYACVSVLGMLGIHTTAAALSAGKQAGFVSLRMFVALIGLALGLAMLSGCTTTTASMYKGVTSEAVAGVKMWDDNTLATVQTVLCAQPYSAIQRHPEIQPGVQALCGPLANTSSLDANQLQLLMNIMSASGIKLSAPAAK